jgi:hypothetical protein
VVWHGWGRLVQPFDRGLGKVNAKHHEHRMKWENPAQDGMEGVQRRMQGTIDRMKARLTEER